MHLPVSKVLTDRLLSLPGRYVLLPVTGLYALGILDDITLKLDETVVALGNIRFSVLTLIRVRLPDRCCSGWGRGRTDKVPTTSRSRANCELAIFGAAFLLLMSIMGIDLTAVAVPGGALGVGETTVGDHIILDGGEAGKIIKMTARACVLVTFDGRQILVPNEQFITTRVVNCSSDISPNRYVAAFSVSYDTEMNLPEIVERAVAALPLIRQKPEPPD